MAIEKTYLDLLEVIRAERADTSESKKTIDSALAEISTKYGIGAAHKAYGACNLDSLGVNKPI